MNNSIKMNSRELLYAASLVGADYFWGITDGFYGMNEAEIRHEIHTVQNTLFEKGYADLDFNDQFSLKEPVKNLVEHCVSCEKYVEIKKTIFKESTSSRMYYWKKEGLVCVIEENQSYCIEKRDPKGLMQEILDFFRWKEEENSAEDIFYMDQLMLEKLSEEKNQEKLMARLHSCGCPEKMAEILVRRMTGSGTNFMFAAVDMQDDKGITIIGTHTQSGTLKITETEVDYEEKIKIEFLQQHSFRQNIKDALKTTGLFKEEKFL